MAGASFAVEPSIQVTVSDKFPEVGEPFTMVVQMDGGPLEKFSPPRIDGLVFQVRRSHTILNGPTTVEFVCKALDAGEITIPSMTARIRGKDVVSEAIVLKVRDAAAGQGQRNPNVRDNAGSRFPETRQATLEDATFLRASVDKTEVYQGEEIQFELTWWHLDQRNVSIGAGSPPTEPQFAGFYSIRQEDARTQETSNGLPYTVIHYRRLLYPTQTGRLVIPSCEIQADVIASVGRVYTTSLDLRTDEIPITVNPLPPRPSNFSGAVGQFTFDAAFSEEVHVQGVPFVLLAKISGRGNPGAIGNPLLPSLDWAQISATDNEIQQSGEGTFAKLFRYTITPLKTGTHTFPEIEFCYFDPAQGEYVTTKAGPFVMPVADSSEDQQAMIHSTDIARDVDRVNVLSSRLLPLDVNVGELRPRHVPKVTLPAAVLAPPFGYVALALYLERKRRFASDSAYARAYRARRRAHTCLGRVGTDRDPVESLYRATTNYLADIANRPEGAITHSDAQGLVARLAIDAETGEKLLKVIRACERQRYGGAELSRDEVDALVRAAEAAIDEVDALMQEGRAR